MSLSDRPLSGEMLEPFRTVQALADSLNAGAKHPTFTVSALKNLLGKRKENGLEPYVFKVGRKVLVSEPGFKQWVRLQPRPEQLRLDFEGGR